MCARAPYQTPSKPNPLVLQTENIAGGKIPRLARGAYIRTQLNLNASSMSLQHHDTLFPLMSFL
jgi:hypothetical protein